jgi:hypothetical protein
MSYKERRKTLREAAPKAYISMALISAFLILNPNVRGAPPIPASSMAGDWGAPPSTQGDQPPTINIKQVSGGRYTIHGQWDGLGDWGTGLIQMSAGGSMGTAVLHGFYPTLYLQVEFRKSASGPDSDTLIVKMRSQWVQNGAVQSANLPIVTLRRKMNL